MLTGFGEKFNRGVVFEARLQNFVAGATKTWGYAAPSRLKSRSKDLPLNVDFGRGSMAEGLHGKWAREHLRPQGRIAKLLQRRLCPWSEAR